MKIALISAPFDSLVRPNIALSILKSALINAGYNAEVIYSNISYAKTIGTQNYTLIAEKFPTSMALGDAIFSHSAFGNVIDWPEYLRDTALDTSGNYDDIFDGQSEILPFLSQKTVAWTSHFAEENTWQQFDLVGICATFNLVPALALARHLKNKWPHIKTILGGAQCDGSLGATIMREFPWIDFVCIGEGESVIVQTCSNISRLKKNHYGIQGLCWRNTSMQVIQNGKRAFEVNINESPTPEFSDWFSARSDLPEDIKLRSSIPIETSRGCWFGEKSHCTFCGLNGEGLKFRQRTPESAMAQLQNALASGIKNIFAVDNILPMSYFDSFLIDIVKLPNLTAELFYEVKANLTRKQCETLRRAGVISIQPGIESLSTNVLRLMKKGTTSFINIRLLKFCAETGLNAVWNFLYGFPHESGRDYELQADLISSIIHLQPPISTGSRVRMDRFSPLYFDSEQLGVTKISPSHAYRHIYFENPEARADLAMFFRFEGVFEDDPHIYTENVRKKISEWRLNAGTKALIAIDKVDEIHIYDDRWSDEAQKSVYFGLTGDLLKACQEGLSFQALADLLRVEAIDDISKELKYLTDKKLLLLIDGKYLSLPIFMDFHKLTEIPDGLQLDLCAAIYKRSMRLLIANQKTYLLEDQKFTWPENENGHDKQTYNPCFPE